MIDEQRRDRRLLASLHPGFPVEEPGESDRPLDFDGGVRGEHESHELDYMTKPKPVGPSDDVGWGPEYEVDASLIFR